MAQGRGYLEFASRSSCLCYSISHATNDIRVAKGDECCEFVVLMIVRGEGGERKRDWITGKQPQSRTMRWSRGLTRLP